MKIVNTNELEEISWTSPKGTMGGFGKQVSEALGRVRDSTDAMLRHPFDVEIQRVEPGKSTCPYHSHSAQWEFYHVVSGNGIMRHEGGRSKIGPGDAMVFKPREPHQLINDGTEDLVVYVVADNPIGESAYYPDSDKVLVKLPDRRIFRGPSLDYFDGEEE